jgi:hypothetical protein
MSATVGMFAEKNESFWPDSIFVRHNRLTDETYAKLLQKTSGKPVPGALRQDFLSYYADLEKPYATKRNPKAWQELVKELGALKSVPVAVAPTR